jgi:hypothetical protein
MKRAQLAACGLLLVLVPEASAHFALTKPTAYSTQASDGSPQKSAPCGQADPGLTVVPTNVVTPYHEGDTVTVTIEEKVFHPGHYRVALADDQSGLPADPAVTPSTNTNPIYDCGAAEIQDASTAGVIVDNMLPHTKAFTGAQSFTFALPAGKTCTNCTLQVIEFMGDHNKNNPGGCYYHHCAQISVVAAGTQLPDAGPVGGSPGAPDAGVADGGTQASGGSGGGCDVGGSGSALAMALGALGLVIRRRR